MLKHPFLSFIKERYPLTKKGSTKETWHVALSLEGANLTFKPGDSIGIFCQNSELLVSKTIAALGFGGDEKVVDKRSLQEMSLKNFLMTKASITHFSRKFLAEVYAQCGLEVIDPKEVMHQHQVWDFMQAHKKARFTPQELADLMMPLLPRLYSVASSQLFNPFEVHLTVAHLKFETSGLERLGVCTDYLCKTAFVGPLEAFSLPIFVQPAHAFALPEDPTTALIMVGPGTGVAPFRAFLQERELTQATGKNWLFFGERTRQHEFFYEQEWRRWEDLGLLKLDLAFSRDQPEKVYVQDRLIEKGAEVIEWLEKGAIFYVCGDAHHMAKDVDHALHKIIETHTSFDPAEYIKTLKKEKRYQRDVY